MPRAVPLIKRPGRQQAAHGGFFRAPAGMIKAMQRDVLFKVLMLATISGVILNLNALQSLPYPTYAVYRVDPDGREIKPSKALIFHSCRPLYRLTALDPVKLAAIQRHQKFQDAAILFDLAAVLGVAYWLTRRRVIRWWSHRTATSG